MSSAAKILIIDDDENLGEVLKRLFRSLDYRVKVSPALPMLAADAECDVCICSAALWQASRQTGPDLGATLQRLSPGCQIILLAEYAHYSTFGAVRDEGVLTVLPKPCRTEPLLAAVAEALRRRGDGAGGDESAAPVAAPVLHYGLLLGEDASMQSLYSQIEKVAPTEMTVLLEGESGTGKELVARAVHQASRRARGPFVAINCASLPESLLESELFGYMRGAFTGAVKNKEGLFLAADGGTLFLDEISAIPTGTQLALLRALQEREIRPVGGVHPVPVNVRIVAASNDNLQKRIADGYLREDLFYRLSVFPLHLPPLRKRGEDPVLLAVCFLQRAAGERPLRFSAEAVQAIRGYRWPGNVRELENAVQRAAALAENGLVRLSDLPGPVAAGRLRQEEVLGDQPERTLPEKMTLKAYLRLCERNYLRYVLEASGGNKEEAAKVLGVSLATLYRKCGEP